MNNQRFPFFSVFVFQNKVVHAEGAASKNIRQGIVYMTRIFSNWEHLDLTVGSI